MTCRLTLAYKTLCRASDGSLQQWSDAVAITGVRPANLARGGTIGASPKNRTFHAVEA